MSADRRSSGVFVPDPEAILARALEAVAIDEPSAVIDEAKARTRSARLPHEADLLWSFCETALVPLVAERVGAQAAERLEARLHGVVLALDAIQTGRKPHLRRRR